ncbi:MAG TPA: DNA polymerase I, partial [Caulobacterales bacterium]|nr:DNA polymerase I [Caulobacterales bacterium]
AKGLFDDAPPTPAPDSELKQIPMAQALEALKPLLEDGAVLKIGQNVKYDMAVFARYGVAMAPTDDTMLISYVLAAGAHNHGMDELSERHLGHKPISFKDVAGAGKNQLGFHHVAIPAATRYSAEDADVTLRLWRRLKPRLARERLLTVYETLERGMPPILVDMELAGVKIDRAALRLLSLDFEKRMADFEAKAHEIAGKTFNIASPKQIGDILFGELGLAGGQKTKTGAWSTDADVLEDLAAQGHALPRTILDWRQLQKLRSTYTEALAEAADKDTDRIHTCFSLAATPTGRLSSTDPNLQNIPIRTEEGRRIREAFIAEPGHVLISADYSQIELRLLAHVADIPELKKAFADGVDIHALTASEMFGHPVEDMDPMIRRQAKAINFGIIYGMSAFGLARNLGIERGEADAYIKRYFERFPGIRTYMETQKARARELGYVTTIFGRRTYTPYIKSTKPAERGYAERQAINAPLQGAGADIIRRAMVRMPAALREAGLKARMLLQVHDELVFEAPEAEADATCKRVAEVMEAAPLPAIQLTVPLTVEARAGKTWAAAH